MAKVTLGGTINIQGTKEIDRTNLAQLREPATITWSIVAGLNAWQAFLKGVLWIALRRLWVSW